MIDIRRLRLYYSKLAAYAFGRRYRSLIAPCIVTITRNACKPISAQHPFLHPIFIPRLMETKGEQLEASPTTIYDGKEYSIVKEGLAEILNPKSLEPPASGKKGSRDSDVQAVFYNPIQQFNRDLSVLAIRIFGEDLAAIRKARHERRLQNIVEKSTRGKKRKRAERDGEDAHQSGTDHKIDIKHGDSTGGLRESPSGGLPISEDQHLKRPEGTQDVEQAFDNSGTPSKPQASIDNDAEKLEETVDTIPKANNPFNSFRVLDALSATGLRALRYAKEIPSVTSVTANDLSPSATASVRLNVQHNQLESKIQPITGNALTHMYRVGSDFNAHLPDRTHGKYEVIDLDPYGTAAPFLDAAVQALTDCGLLCVTCTDSSIFASTGYVEKTFSQYGGLPSKGPQSHEAGLRLILHAIAASAARYGIAIEPLLSLSIDFYVRLFVRVRRSPAEVKFLAGKTMLVYNCDSGCGSWTTQFLAQTKVNKNAKQETFHKFSLGQGPTTNTHCEHCGFKTHLAGPMWGGPLHNPYFIERILDLLPSLDTTTYATIPRIEGMLSTALHETLLDSSSSTSPIPPSTSPEPNEENRTTSNIPRLDPSTPDHHPFFLIPSNLAKILHCVAPSHAALRGALLHLGYRATRSHTRPNSVRTDAPWSVIWDIMREWVRQKAPVKAGAIKQGMAGWGIMRKERASGVESLRKEVVKILEKVEGVEEATTEIEAALFRAGKKGRSDEGKAEAEAEAKGEEGEEKRLKVVFDENLGREKETKKLVRYQVNPRPNWGPMNRAKGGDL